MEVKRPGDLLYLLGMTRDELGGSEYYAGRGFVGGSVPKVKAEEARERYLRLREAIYYGLVASAHDASDGGLGVALAEKAFAGGLGLFVDLSAVPYEGSGRPDFVLFSESASRILVTVPREKQRDFEKLMEGTVYARIGEVIAEPELIIRDGLGRDLVKEPLSELKSAWKRTLSGI